MLYRLCRHVLFERHGATHVLHHTLVNGHVLTGNPCTNQTLLYSMKGELDFEQWIVTRGALRFPIPVVAEMKVSAHEGERISRHDIAQVGNADAIAAFAVQTACRWIVRAKVRSL
jgi:hypothetical protein